MKYCAIDFHDGGWVKVGICIAARSEKAEVTPTGFRYTYTYYCAPLES